MSTMRQCACIEPFWPLADYHPAQITGTGLPHMEYTNNTVSLDYYGALTRLYL